MNQYTLAVQASFQPEVLERILRVVRHRGFRVCTMNMHTDQQNHRDVHIQLTVESLRPVELLSSQLSKLVDVAAVSSHPNQYNQIQA